MSPENDIDNSQIVEAILFSSRSALTAKQIAGIVGIRETNQIKKLINDLNLFYKRHSRAFFIEKVGGGYQLRTLREYQTWIKKGKVVRPFQLSQTVMETLAIVAYQQPVTRAEIEEIRSVDATYALKTLLDKKLIKIVGRKDIIGRPILYATSKLFLELFGFNSINDLPRPEDFDLIFENSSTETIDGNEG